MRLRLGVNIDHVATVRNARGGDHPDPVRAAEIAVAAGADGITAHLREDRRHIRDDDIVRLRALLPPLNLEMAATDEMLAIALQHRPHAVRIVPERRAELTRELMAARRAVRDARGEPEATASARAGVDAAKRALGERGEPWWTDGAPDLNRRMARTTIYADWFAALD